MNCTDSTDSTPAPSIIVGYHTHVRQGEVLTSLIRSWYATDTELLSACIPEALACIWISSVAFAFAWF